MNLRYQRLTSATALLVTLAVGQLYVGITFAEANSALSVSGAVPVALMGILTTSNNKPITVNGASAISGATIPSGATIETPDGVGATIRLGSLGSLCIAPNTKLSLEFDQQGKLLRITVTEGCVILRTSKNVTGAINGPQGVIGQIAASATGGSLDVCLKAGVAPSINQGAAVDAHAGASAVDCGAAGAAAAPPTGIPPAVTAAFIGGGVAGLYLLFRGSNPSPSGP
ncbi:MAG TPA: hypothetical protein VEM96_12460 [Pyrinomonadaceae bacterium]|nr:hypothetical protein [Pyrinomonadaceae bacterium]